MKVEISQESARGCGYRKSGKEGYGLYLMGDGIFSPCERLPFPLGCCPTCGEGVKFSRGFTWILPSKLLAAGINPVCDPQGEFSRFFKNHNHELCLMCSPPENRHGLLWVGEKFYSPGTFAEEAVTRGVSKRISGIPHGFEIGTHYVYLAHNHALVSLNEEGESSNKAGIFMAFRPNRLDIVVDETDLEKLPKHAIKLAEKWGEKARLVKVEKLHQTSILEEEESDE